MDREKENNSKDCTDNKNCAQQIAFFFGAGAECSEPFNMPTGKQFLYDSLLLGSKKLYDENKSDDNTNSREKEINESLESLYKKVSYSFSSNNKYKYTDTKRNFIASEKSLFEKLIRNTIIAKLEENYNSKDSTSSDAVIEKLGNDSLLFLKSQDKALFKFTKELNESTDLNNIIKDKIITNYAKNYVNDEIVFTEDFTNEEDQLFVKNILNVDNKISLSGILDDYFKTIINPMKLGKIKFTKLINYYWSAYLCILERILIFIKKHRGCFEEQFQKNHIKLDDLLYEEKDYSKNTAPSYRLRINKVLDQKTLINITKALYSFNYKDACFSKTTNSYFYNNYYCKVREIVDACNLIGVITTNYYNFAESIIKLSNQNAIFSYPNGQLKYFEFPTKLEVKDFSVLSTQIGNQPELFFPFIFGQSFVKPMVHPIQIKEFIKMKEILNNSNVLIMIGYGINSDDNHINSYLHEFLLKEKCLIYVHYTKNKVTNVDEEKSKMLNEIRTKLYLNNSSDQSEDIENVSNIKIVLTYYGDKDLVKNIKALL